MHDRAVPVMAVVLMAVSVADGGVGAAVHVAEKHLAFVREVTAEKLRISTDLKAISQQVEDSGCRLRDYDAAKMVQREVRLAQRYAAEYCQPWQKLWDKALKPCDKDRPPAWCDDENALPERVDLEGYFLTMAMGLDGALSSLERDNIMDIMTSTLAAHIVTQFPRPSLERWTTAVVVPYLRHATPGQAVALANDLKETWVGLAPTIMRAFDDFLDSATEFTEAGR